MAIKRGKKEAKATKDKDKEKKPARSSRSAPKKSERGRSQTKKRLDNKPQKLGIGGLVGDRKIVLKQNLLAKRDALTQAMRQQLGQSLTDEQQRSLEAANVIKKNSSFWKIWHFANKSFVIHTGHNNNTFLNISQPKYFH